MHKPIVILDPHWRMIDELFSAADIAALQEETEVIWGQDAPIPDGVRDAALHRADVLISAEPKVDAALLAAAPHLKAVIEVSGAFPATIDYPAAFTRGIHVLSCAPGFRFAVAEMALGMILASARGLVTQHEAFRTGDEAWLADLPETDFTLYGAEVGFVGFGRIAWETAAVMRPFGVKLRAYDPWCPPEIAAEHGADLVSLEEAMAARIVIIAASPTAENKAMIGAEQIAHIADGGLLVVISRAHVVDFDAVLAAARSGRIRVATDVFPLEPVPSDDPMRQTPNIIFSPHRAAAIEGGRQPIGAAILSDIRAIAKGGQPSALQIASPETVASRAAANDGAKVGDIAKDR